MENTASGSGTTVEAENRERRLASAFVALADNLVVGFDLAELFDDLLLACVDLLELAAAGLLLADQRGALRPVASSSEQTRLLELFELQNDEGPCLDCYRDGTRVGAVDDEALDRWPMFGPEARALGFGPVYALPMRLREQTIGALNLFRPVGAPLTDHDLGVGQALADVATIAILQHRARVAEQQLAEELQTALNSRIAIEQAKGMIAEFAQVDMDRAFAALRGYARSNGVRLTEVAMAVASGQIAVGRVAAAVERDGEAVRQQSRPAGS